MSLNPRTDSQQKLLDIRLEQERVQRDYLVVSSSIAEASRAFFVDKVPLSSARRAELLARQKVLLLELHDLRVAQRKEKSRALELRGQTFLSALLDRCIAAGRVDLVNEARAEADESLVQAGLLDAYRMRTL